MKKRSAIGIVTVLGIFLMCAILIASHTSTIPAAKINQNQQLVQYPDEQSDQVMGRLSHTVNLEKSVKNNLGEIMVYKTIPGHYTREDILIMAKKFNISPIGRIKELAEGSSVASVDGKVQAILHNSGFAEYHNSSQKRIVNSRDNLNNFISDDEAVNVATNFLKNRDLLPEGAELIGTDHTEIHGIAKDGSETVFREDVEVWYGRQLNGMNVEGTQLMLAIDADGNPFDYFTNWRSYEPYKKMPVKNPEKAFEDLQTKGVPVGMNNPDKVTINDMYLAYRTKAGAETETYLEPVWVFKGNVMVDGKSVMPVEQYIPALTETPKEFVTVSPIATKTIVKPTSTTTIPQKSTLPASNATIIPTTTASPTATITVNETVITTATATITPNVTATSPVPTDTVSITPTTSLNITPVTTTGNSTAG